MDYDKENIFAKILRGEIPSDKVYEDEYVFAFNDINPQTPVHILIVPKAEMTRLGDCTDNDVDMLGRLNVAAANIAREQGLESFRTVMNSGSGAGQTVFHLHLHLLGGKELTESII